MDSRNLSRFKKLLLEEKQRLISYSKQTIQTEISISSDDLADETDLAAVEVSQNLVFRLKDRERNLISKIDQALQRIDTGVFGTCLECEEPIEKGRLEVRPVSTLCLSCKEMQEHRERVYA